MSEISIDEKKIINNFSDIDEDNYSSHILKIISLWKIDNNKKYDFIVLGEAFNWKRLAYLILDNMNVDKILKSKILLWISSPHIYAGFSEKEFKGLIGYEKYSAHLSYFYGIIIERCLLCFVEQELIKRQASYGNFVRFNPDDAFQKIYEFSFTEMFKEFCEEYRIDINNYSELDDEKFTYWCFKKRVDFSEPSKLASDTKKGTTFLSGLLSSESKRLKNNNTKKFSTKSKNIDYAF